MEAIIEIAETSSNVELVETPHTVTCGVPEIKSLDDIMYWEIDDHNKVYEIRQQIIAYTTTNPDEEHIYKLELGINMDLNDTSAGNSWMKNCMKSLEAGETMNSVVAGSYALW